MKKIILILLSALLLCTAFTGCGFEVDEGVKFNTELVYTLVGEGEDAYYIVGKCADVAELGLTKEQALALDYEVKAEKLGTYGGTLKTVTVPAEHQGLPVKGVGAFAFYLCGAEQIILPETVEFIGSDAFRNCGSLKTVKCGNPDGGSALAKMGETLFYGSERLTSVYVYSESAPEVSSLGPQNEKSVFYGTFYPAVIVPNNSVEAFKTDDKWYVYGDYVAGEDSVYVNGQIIEKGRFIKYAGTAVNVSISSVTEYIGQYAFKGSDVQTVEIPASVKEINRQAFYDCKALTSVHYGEGSVLETIGISAFEGCSLLRTAVLPASLKIVKDKAFESCTSLDTVYVEGLGIEYIYTNVFAGCDALADVFFVGTAEQFAEIDVRSGNEKFTSAHIVYSYTK